MAEATNMKTLADLGLTAQNGAEANITGLSVDSRLVKPGHLFAALPGARVHGGEFIQFALRMKAGAILTDPEGARIAARELAASDAALVVVEDPRMALAYAAALWSGAQQQPHIALVDGYCPVMRRQSPPLCSIDPKLFRCHVRYGP